MLLNPASTGDVVSGGYRAGVSYNSIKVGNVETAKMLAGYWEGSVSGRLGIGFAFSHNMGNNNFVKNTQFLASVSYNVPLDAAQSWFLRFGMQGGMLSRAFDTGGLVFEDQIDVRTVRPSGERFGNSAAFSPNINAGLMLLMNDVGQSIRPFIGYSLSNLIRPVFQLSELTYTLPLKQVFQGGVNIATPSFYTLVPHVIIKRDPTQTQTSIYLNALVHTRVDQPSMVVGLGVRNQSYAASSRSIRTLLPMLGFYFDRYFVGTSYDIGMNRFGGLNQSSWQISLTFQPMESRSSTPLPQF